MLKDTLNCFCLCTFIFPKSVFGLTLCKFRRKRWGDLGMQTSKISTLQWFNIFIYSVLYIRLFLIGMQQDLATVPVRPQHSVHQRGLCNFSWKNKFHSATFSIVDAFRSSSCWHYLVYLNATSYDSLKLRCSS